MNARERGTAPTTTERRTAHTPAPKKPENVIQRYREKIENIFDFSMKIFALLFFVAGFGFLVFAAVYTFIGIIKDAHTETIIKEKPIYCSVNVQRQEEPEAGTIFEDTDGALIDMQSMTSAWAAEAGFEKRYDLTDSERWIVASVVTAEAQTEPFAGKMAVAQCILQGCEDEGMRPDELVVEYKYTKRRPQPSQEALEAVQAVFDLGQVVTKEPIKYFYAPALVYGSFHESQDHVITINNHKFFKEAAENGGK